MADAARRAVFCLLAEFDSGTALLEAVRRAHAAGYRQIEAHSPFPLEEMPETLGFREQKVPVLTLAGGIVGAALGYGIQAYANLDFPIDIGNRPPVATPAFMLITFELMVLCAVASAILGMLVLNRLPRLHHPLFEDAEFHLLTLDKFFLAISPADDRFHPERTPEFLRSLDPVRVSVIYDTDYDMGAG